MTIEQHAFQPRSAVQVTPTTLLVPTPMVAASSIVLSDPMIVDLLVYRGDSGGFRISVKDSNGDPLDVSGATWDSDIRLTGPATTVITNFDIVLVDEDTSSIDVVLTAESSNMLIADCVYDVEMTLGADVRTLVRGGITVTQDVSRA